MLTVAIQAGGQSARMGEDKALKPFLGRPLIARVIDRLQPIADELIVTTNRPAEYAFLGLPLFADLRPGRGALGGLYTAIASAKSPLVAVAACDLPFVSARLLETAARRLVEENVDVVIPRSAAGLEPMHAVYRRETCLPVIEAAIEGGLWKVIAWFPQVKVLELAADDERAFWNINTPEEFSRAEAMVKGLNVER
ncbi:MAG: molybdenum cofactor guanylyltransferase [Chloroflexota bacterium]